MTASDALWRAACSRVVLPGGDVLQRAGMWRRAKHLDAAQSWPRDRLDEERDRLVRDLLVETVEATAYRRLYADAGIDVADIRRVRDLTHLPLVDKAFLRRGYPHDTTRPTGRPTYDECSAGSTGEPLCVREDAPTAAWYRATYLQILSWAGWRPGDRHVQFGMNLGRSRGRALKDAVLRCTYVSGFDLRDDALDSVIERLRRDRIRFVLGYPGAVHALASRAIARAVDLQPIASVTWGDTLDASARSDIERAFGRAVLDSYGIAEGIWIASQCERAGGYHVHELDVVVELVDEQGAPVADGETGEVVVTRLRAGATPLVRYRTGDLAVRHEDARCVCGRTWELIGELRGRTADTIVTPTGNRLIVHTFTGILEHHPEIAAFQVAKTADDVLEVRVVPRGGDVPRAALDAIAAAVPDMRVILREVSVLPRTAAGKRRFVVDETQP